jgi:hypothetical protein
MTISRIRTAPWVYAVLIIITAFCASGVALMSAGELGWEFWGTVIILVICLIALIDALFTKIENNGEFLVIVYNFKKQQIRKANIKKVLWEKGVSSSMELVNGTFVKLPVTGRSEQGVVNSVRSWLNKP